MKKCNLVVTKDNNVDDLDTIEFVEQIRCDACGALTSKSYSGQKHLDLCLDCSVNDIAPGSTSHIADLITLVKGTAGLKIVDLDHATYCVTVEVLDGKQVNLYSASDVINMVGRVEDESAMEFYKIKGWIK